MRNRPALEVVRAILGARAARVLLALARFALARLAHAWSARVRAVREPRAPLADAEPGSLAPACVAKEHGSRRAPALTLMTRIEKSTEL